MKVRPVRLREVADVKQRFIDVGLVDLKKNRLQYGCLTLTQSQSVGTYSMIISKDWVLQKQLPKPHLQVTE